MLEVGRDRAVDRGLLRGLTWATGDAEHLPFPDRSFDAYTIAFGLRNVTDIDQALRDAHRVLKPGGRFFCLEFSKVTSAPVGRVYDAYSERALPFFGRVIARMPIPIAICTRAFAAFRRSANWRRACGPPASKTCRGATCRSAWWPCIRAGESRCSAPFETVGACCAWR